MDQAEKLRSVVKLKKQNYKPDARVITVTSGKRWRWKVECGCEPCGADAEDGKKGACF